MKILLISNTCSEKEFKRIQSIKFAEKVSPQQNYFSMLIEGLLQSTNVDITCITIRSIACSNTRETELEAYCERINNRLCFIYTKVVAKNGIRNINNIIETKRQIKQYLKQNKNEEITLVIDPLSIDTAFGTIISAKKIKKIAIVTDIPYYVADIGKTKHTFARWFINHIKQMLFMKCISRMDGFCFLTESMQEINRNKVPYCVLEGMVPDNISFTERNTLDKKKVVLYAGGLYETFGVKNLVEAAKKINDSSFELQIYGEGNCVDFIKKQSEIYKQIKYMGVVGLNEIKEAERKATLLVNPRMTTENYTKYSFPSKTLEYMSSGRPLLTTKLAGIPEEYFKYVFLIDNENAEGIYNAITYVLNLTEKELDEVGKKAFEFVNRFKKASIQAKKIYQLMKLIHQISSN